MNRNRNSKIILNLCLLGDLYNWYSWYYCHIWQTKKKDERKNERANDQQKKHKKVVKDRERMKERKKNT